MPLHFFNGIFPCAGAYTDKELN